MGTLSPESLILAVAVVSALAGALVTWVLGYISRDRMAKRQRRPAPASAPPAGPETSASAEGENLLRVSRAEKELAVFVQGQRYHYLHEIADAHVGRDTLEAVQAVLTFAEGWLPAAREASAEPAPPKTTADGETFLERLRQADLFSGPGSSAPAEPEVLNLVEQIDDLVQKRLEERPDLAQKHIYLATGVAGDLRIHVGQQTLRSVREISDPEVRALIEDAIHEWEGR